MGLNTLYKHINKNYNESFGCLIEISRTSKKPKQRQGNEQPILTTA